MARIELKDLEVNKELDAQEMQNIVGGKFVKKLVGWKYKRYTKRRKITYYKRVKKKFTRTIKYTFIKRVPKYRLVWV